MSEVEILQPKGITRFFILALIIILSAPPSIANTKLAEESVLLHTNYGDITLGLFSEVAPKTTEQILRLTRAHVFDGMAFYRLEKGFVLQLENYDARKSPVSLEQRQQVEKLPLELSSLKHVRGMLSLARYDDDPNSGEASFSILLGDAPHLDGQYTVFGQVISGMDIVEKIEGLEVHGTAPASEVFINSAELIETKIAQHQAFQIANQTAHAKARNKLYFEWFAGIMFLITMLTPIIQSLWPRITKNHRVCSAPISH